MQHSGQYQLIVEPPSASHIEVWRKEARELSDSELRFMRLRAERNVSLAYLEVDKYPIAVSINSLINGRAMIAAVDAEVRARSRVTPANSRRTVGFRSDDIRALKSCLSIEQEVSQHVKLRRQGKRLVGKCPFHPDRTPSFFVRPDVGDYRCFGCQASGDVIDWQQAIGKMTFAEAVAVLSDRAGIQLPKRNTRHSDPKGYWV